MSDRQDKPKHTARKVIGGIIGLIIVITIVASANNKPTVTTTSTKTTSSTTAAKAAASTAKVGDTISIGGNKGIAVTLQQIIDPAQGADQYTTPDAGKRFVAVDVKIMNNGKSSYQDDANTNITVIGTDNQSYNFDPNNVSECTNFNSGQYTLAAGESETGCVVFQLPNNVNAAKVQFQTESGFSGNTGEWIAQ